MSDRQDQTERAFVRRMIEVRETLRLSQLDLAVRVGFARSLLANIECGRRSVKLGEAVRIAEALGLSLDDMLRPGEVVVTVAVSAS